MVHCLFLKRATKALNLMSLQWGREPYTITDMRKLLHGKCPNDVNIQFSTRFRHGQKAVIPTLKKSSSQHNQTLYSTFKWAIVSPKRFGPSFLPLSIAYCIVESFLRQ